MTSRDPSALATAIVIATGVLWGLYWLPVRALEEAGLAGAWGTAAITGAAALTLSPLAWRERTRLRAAAPSALAGVALGGMGFALYSIGFVYGRVAVVILLFFLTPVWSTLIGRLFLGWPVAGRRLAALVLGLGGLVCVLGADGGVPVPRAPGEWLGLISGVMWAVATTTIRLHPPLPMGGSAFVFASGATVASLVLAGAFAPMPGWPGAGTMALAVGTGLLWWGLSMVGLMWAASRLEPARVGILLMAEVLIGTASAAVIAGEAMGPLVVLGGALVLAAGVVEVLPARRR